MNRSRGLKVKLRVWSLTLMSLALAAPVCAGVPDGEWRVRTPGADGDPYTPFVPAEVTRIRQIGTVDAQGNSYLAAMSYDGFGTSLLVQKRSPGGEWLWSRRFEASRGRPSPLASTQAGMIDVSAAGVVGVAFERPDDLVGFLRVTTVVSLRGEDGGERWRVDVGNGGPFDVVPVGLRLDSAGNHVLLATYGEGQQFPRSAVIKLLADDGALAWPGLPQGIALSDDQFSPQMLRLTASGDIVVGGQRNTSGRVYSYDGASGLPEWTFYFDPGGPPDFSSALSDLVVAPGGDVALSFGGQRFGAVKLSGASGLPVWSTLPGGAAIQPGIWSDGGSRSVALDDAGHVIVSGTGRLTASPDRNELVVVKYDSVTGAPSWGGLADGASRHAVLEAGDAPRPESMFVDEAGDIVVAGGGAPTGEAFALKLRGSDGSIAWTGLPGGAYVHDSPDGLNGPENANRAHAVAPSAAGGVRVSGTQMGEKNLDLLAIELDESGQLLWSATEAPHGLMAEEFAENIAGVPEGRVNRNLHLSLDGASVLAGMAALESVEGHRREPALYKLDALGATEWRARVSHPDVVTSKPRAVLQDGTGGNIVVSETTTVDLDRPIQIAKFAGIDGTMLWSRLANLDQATRLRIQAALLAPDGDLLLAMNAEGTPTSQDILIARYSGVDGSLVWEMQEDGGAGGFDAVAGMVLDSLGRVVVVARFARPGGTFESVIQRYDAASGNTAGVSSISGLISSDLVHDIALDSAGDLVALITRMGSSPQLPMVLKLRVSDGQALWSRVLNGIGASCQDRTFAVDATGDVTLACWAVVSGTTSKIVAAKLGGADGALAWSHLPDGLAEIAPLPGRRERLYGLAVDSAGRPALTLASSITLPVPVPSQIHGRVVMLDSATGSVTRSSEVLAETQGGAFLLVPAFAPDGSLRVAGTDITRGGPRMLLARYETVSPRADLLALSASAGALTPAFDPALRAYALSVPHASASTTITASASDPAATLRVAGNAVGNGVASDPIALATGPNRIPVEVQVIDGPDTFAATYVVTVTRLRLSQSIDFPAPGDQTYVPGGTFGVSASGGGSGNPVRFSSLTPAVCTVLDSTVTMQSPGECDIAADQDGDDDHDAAPQVVRSVTILPGTDAIFGDGFEAAQAGRR